MDEHVIPPQMTRIIFSRIGARLALVALVFAACGASGETRDAAGDSPPAIDALMRQADELAARPGEGASPADHALYAAWLAERDLKRAAVREVRRGSAVQ